jgi:hypothetical protein
MTSYYIVSCEYPAKHYPAMDEKLEAKVGKPSDGSGMMLCEPLGDQERQRDLCWYFKTAPKAVEAFLKLGRVRNLSTLEMRKYREEEPKLKIVE